jgi:hypothetical protein
LFLPSPDLLFGIFLGVIGHLWQQGRIVEELQHSSRAWHHSVRALALHTTRSTLVLIFIEYSAFGGLWSSIGAFCSSSYYIIGSIC